MEKSRALPFSHSHLSSIFFASNKERPNQGQRFLIWSSSPHGQLGYRFPLVHMLRKQKRLNLSLLNRNTMFSAYIFGDLSLAYGIFITSLGRGWRGLFLPCTRPAGLALPRQIFPVPECELHHPIFLWLQWLKCG